MKALVFQPDQRLREQPQFVRRFFHRRDHGSRFLPETIKKRPVDEERNQEEIAQQRGETLRQPQNPQVARVEGEESRQAEQSQRGQRPRPGLRESRGEQRRRFAPGSQRHGIDAGAGLFRQDGQLFAQIHARPQLLHRPLPREHRGGSGRSEQRTGRDPARKDGPDPGSGRRTLRFQPSARRDAPTRARRTAPRAAAVPARAGPAHAAPPG